MRAPEGDLILTLVPTLSNCEKAPLVYNLTVGLLRIEVISNHHV